MHLGRQADLLKLYWVSSFNVKPNKLYLYAFRYLSSNVFVGYI